MNALYVICGLGFLSLVAEIANLKKYLASVIILGLIAAVALAVSDWSTSVHYFNDMVVFDNFSLAFTSLIIVVSIFWFWMSGDYFRGQSHQTDRSAMILFTMSGAVIMVSFSNMAMLFLGIEILSISMYVLAGSKKESLLSNEASFKYFIMGSFATGFLLMGIALVYGSTGSFHLAKIASFISTHPDDLPGFFYAGVMLLLVGMAFKISAVPFHFWAPDVYDGAPVTITAYMSTVVKIAAVAAFYRIFAGCLLSVKDSWETVLQVMTVLTLVIPNLTAAYQSSVKRMLAYSSIGNVGYILLVFAASGASSAGTIFYYLTAYSIASIAAFCVLHHVENSNPSDVSFRGLFGRNPLLAVAMTTALLSLAGIPPLAGFFGKYMVFAQAIQNGFTGLVILGVVTSLIGVYYYFRVVVDMYMKEPVTSSIELTLPTQILLFVLIALILLVGVFPNSLIALLANL